MSGRPKPSIRVAWDGEDEHPSYLPQSPDDDAERSGSEEVPVSAVASAAVVVVKNNTPVAVMGDEELESLRPSYEPSTSAHVSKPPPVRTERTKTGMPAVLTGADAKDMSGAKPASSDSYVPPAPTDPPRSLRPRRSIRSRKRTDEFDFDTQVRAEGTLLSERSRAPDELSDPREELKPSSDGPEAIDDETELAQDVSEPPGPIEERAAPPPAPSGPPKARITSEGKPPPPPVPSEPPRKKRTSQEPTSPQSEDVEALAPSEEGRDLAAIPVLSDVVITDGAASVAPAPAPAEKPTRNNKPAWYDTFFDESYLRTYRVPPPDAVSRQCDFIEVQLDLSEGARILDVGCGLGLQAKELSRRGYQVTGIDSSSTMLALAREADHGVVFLEHDMRELPFEGEFDGAICWGTSFGYFDDLQNKAVVEQVRNAVRPNGMLLIDVVNRDYVMRSQPNLIWFEGDGCVCLEESDFNSITSRLHVKRTTVLSDGRQLETPYSMRLYSVHELGQVLHTKGFRAKRVSGHPATPGVFFGADSPRIIMAAERRSSSKMDRNTVSPSAVALRRTNG